MANCVKLLWANTEDQYIPPIFLEADGSVSLDTDEQFTTRLTKQLEELTDINKLKTDGILPNSLPTTPKNDAILKRFALANIIDNKFLPATVLTIIGSKVLKQTRLFVSLYKDQRYEIEFKHEKKHWLEQLNDLTLNKVILSENKFLFTPDTIQANWLLDEYVDGEDNAIRLPLTWFGRFIDKKNTVGVSDFRPYVSTLWYCQKMFCQVGWKFRSPFLESDIGRRHISYLVSKNIGKSSNLLELRGFSVTNSVQLNYGPSSFYTSIAWNQIISDPSGGYDPSNGSYGLPGVSDIYMDFIVQLVWNFPAPPSKECIAVARLCMTIDEGNPAPSNYIIDKVELPFYQFDSNAFNTFVRFKETFTDVQIDANTILYITIHLEGFDVNDSFPQFFIPTGGKFWGIAKQLFINDGDEYFINDLLDEEETCLDFFKGEVHKIAGKVYTDYVNQEVWLYPSYSTKLANDEIVEGFFIEETIDLSYKIQKNSEVVTTPNRDLKRYLQLKFKGEGDNQIQKFKLTEGRSYLDYKIDFGDQFEDDTETLENPFYQATGNYKYTDEFTILKMAMPALLDNDEDKPSFDVGMRTLYWHGWDNVLDDSFLTGTIIVPMRLFGIVSSRVPIAYQFSDVFYNLLTPIQSDVNIAYGEPSTPNRPMPKDKDLFNQFYKRWIYDTRFNISINLLVFISTKDYFNYSLRKKYRFISKGRTVFGRIIEIADFDVCKYISTPIELVPSRQMSNDCTLIGDGGGDDITIRYDTCVGNMPQLLIDLVGDCYQFSLGGTSSDVVSMTIFEWRYIGDALWNVDVEVCNATAPFEVRMTVVYDECPEIVIRRKFNACNNNPKISATWNYNDNCLMIEIIGDMESTIDTILIEWSLDEMSWTTYVDGSCVEFEDETLVYIRATVTYEGDCDPTELEYEILVIPNMLCSDITATLECTPEGGFNKIGDLPATPATDEIFYRYNESDEWIKWTGDVPIKSGAITAKRIITFCNDECPTYCSEIIECVGWCSLDVTISYGTIAGGTVDLETNIIECDTDLEYKWYLCDESGEFVIIPGAVGSLLEVSIENNTYKVIVMCGECFGSAIISVSDKFAWGAGL